MYCSGHTEVISKCLSMLSILAWASFGNESIQGRI